jgi:hypothetical protein
MRSSNDLPLPVNALKALGGKLANGRSEAQDRVEWAIPGSVGGVPVSACPDYGSTTDIISHNFVQRYRFPLNPASTAKVKLANGRFLHTLGTVSLPFKFANEAKVYHRVFTVLPNCVQDVLLGQSFLKATKTLTKFTYRLKKTIMKVPSRLTRLFLIGSPDHRVQRRVNGHTVQALPDTGSDVMIMSKKYADACGFHIETGSSSREWLELADHSEVCTYGTVIDATWSFGGYGCDEESYRCDFHVLENLSCDVILSNGFLFETGAFSAYEQYFLDFEEDK